VSGRVEDVDQTETESAREEGPVDPEGAYSFRGEDDEGGEGRRPPLGDGGRDDDDGADLLRQILIAKLLMPPPPPTTPPQPASSAPPPPPPPPPPVAPPVAASAIRPRIGFLQQAMRLTPQMGSERFLAEGDELIGPMPPSQSIQIALHIKLPDDRLIHLTDQRARDPLRAGPHLTREQYGADYAAKPHQLAQIRRFALRFGFEIAPNWTAARLSSNPLAHRIVLLRGQVADVNSAFGIRLALARRQNGEVYRTYVGPYSIPDGFEDTFDKVLNLDTRANAKPQLRLSRPMAGGLGPGVSYAPSAVAQAYGFPTDVTGKGQTIAILELGGGGRLRDLRRYFTDLGLRLPSVKAVGVGNGSNRPTGNPSGPDGEVMLDIEVAGAIANGANYVIYFAPNTSFGFFQAITAAINDTVNRPNILSISWGGPEESWTKLDMLMFTEAFRAAAAIGMSVFAAAGDNGSTDGVRGRTPHVDFPASSPWATACGGTSLLTGNSGRQEKVWNDGEGGGTGGGVSGVFSVPYYQQPVVYQSRRLTMRGVPDVAGCADPATGYKIRIDGVDTVVGGTSAVAPLWAGLTALLNESLGSPVGFLNPLLYLTNLKATLNDVTQGNNDTTGGVGNYPAGPGWDACTGWGTPNGAAMLAALRP
jgi:kumamolisin